MKKSVIYDKVKGVRRLSNFVWSIFLTVGGFSFILSGLSCYLRKNLFLFTDTTSLLFIPQGIIMLFYGTISLLLGIYTILILVWNIGSGYNEYNKTENIIKIVRKGFPGKNEKILLTYPLSSVKAIGIKVSERLSVTRNLYLCLGDERQIPLAQVIQLDEISSLETKATELAEYLGLNLETIY